MKTNRHRAGLYNPKILRREIKHIQLSYAICIHSYCMYDVFWLVFLDLLRETQRHLILEF